MLVCCAVPSQTYFIFMASWQIEIVRIMILIKIFICLETSFLPLKVEIKPNLFQFLALENNNYIYTYIYQNEVSPGSAFRQLALSN